MHLENFYLMILGFQNLEEKDIFEEVKKIISEKLVFDIEKFHEKPELEFKREELTKKEFYNELVSFYPMTKFFECSKISEGAKYYKILSIHDCCNALSVLCAFDIETNTVYVIVTSAQH